jgi:MtN3 and saliva related transmembrane protein
MKLIETDGAVMTTDSWIVVVGTVAGFCTTFAFVPQLIKIWRQGGRDLSYGMLALYLIGAILWFIYGVLLHAQAVIITKSPTSLRHRDCTRYRNESLDGQTRRYQSVRQGSD